MAVDLTRAEDPLLAPVGADEPVSAGTGPYRLAFQRLRRNRTALVFGVLFLLIVVACLLAPVYANDIAHTGPNTNHITEVLHLGGRKVDVVDPTGIPTGPTWHSHFLLGADPNGRDVAVRLLYGGRNSLEIGVLATIITMVLATVAGLVAGYFRGWPDGIISRLMDLIWAYPAVLLGVALGVNLALGGISVGPIHLHGSSNWIPALVIGVVFVPYVARPLRGQVLGLREREYVDAARTLGAGHLRIMVGELLPNLASTLVVFVALQLAQSIVLEAALSFLGAGVQPPNASWGTMISSGVQLITVAPHLVLAPGMMLIAAVLSVNVFGEGLRAALDPRAAVRHV
ncbi:MAG TPA: ABC transporter permease [Acidimicrobiales bacterium]|nr:ABC transporter permease [Acidimicrobiales bacterium]